MSNHWWILRFHFNIKRIINNHCSVHIFILDKLRQEREDVCFCHFPSHPTYSPQSWIKAVDILEKTIKNKNFQDSVSRPLSRLLFLLIAGAPDGHTIRDETVLVPLRISGKEPVLVSNVSIEVALLCSSMGAIGATIRLLPCVNSHVSTENGGFLGGVTAVRMLTHPHSILPQRWGVSLFLTVSCRGIPQGRLLPKRNSHILGPLRQRVGMHPLPLFLPLYLFKKNSNSLSIWSAEQLLLFSKDSA